MSFLRHLRATSFPSARFNVILARVNGDETAAALIPVRNRRQAMDWSLVLTSQEIAVTILQDAATGQWALEVLPPDMARALAVLRAYQAENRGWRWQREYRWPGTAPGVAFHWAGPVAAFYLTLWHVVVAGYFPAWEERGYMDGAAWRGGEWWRVVTAVTLHADFGHLISNVTTGAILFGLQFARFGPGVGALLSLLTGVLANGFSAFIYPDPYRSLGASGVVLGSLGLLVGQAVVTFHEWSPGWGRTLGAVAAGGMLFLLLGSDPRSDLVVHLGGFATGLVLGAMLGRWSERQAERPRPQWVAGAICLIVLGVSWGFALL